MIRNGGTGYGLHIHNDFDGPLIYLSAAALEASYGIQGVFSGLTTGAAISCGCNNPGFTGDGVIAAGVGSTSATGSALYAVQAGLGPSGRFDTSQGLGVDIESSSSSFPGQRIFMTAQADNEGLQITAYNPPTGSGKALTVYGGTSGSTLGASISPAGDGYFAGNLAVVGSEVDFTGLPTSDPHVAGRLWSNSGILTVSAG
jgi:hypothetical protein